MKHAGSLRPLRCGEVMEEGMEKVSPNEVFEIIEVNLEEDVATLRRKTDGELYSIPLDDLEAYFLPEPN